MIEVYEDIDWQLLWRNSRRTKSWKSKNARDWSKKSSSFAQRTRHSEYVSQLLEIINIPSGSTVLDVGCGPGTLAVPIAKLGAQVTALDYSEGMLAELDDYAREQNINNIKTIHCSWEDDWESLDIGEYDFTIASRSMNIDGLAEGIDKLHRHAIQQVVIADRIAPSPFDPAAFQAIGREFRSGPDYIYTVNMLYHLGFHPHIDHIMLPVDLHFSNREEAFLSYQWMFRDLSDHEEHLLRDFVFSRITKEDKETVCIRRSVAQMWAVLSWTKSDDIVP